MKTEEMQIHPQAARHASRLRIGHRMDVDPEVMDEWFPHPYKPSRAEIEETITLAIEGSIPPPKWCEKTQQEKINEWTSKFDLNVWQEPLSGVWTMEKIHPLCGCGRRMQPMKGQVVTEWPEPDSEPDSIPEPIEIKTAVVDGYGCPICGRFTPNPTARRER